MPFDQAREYLARVLPWPQQGERTFIDIIWSFTSKEGDKRWSGRAATTVDDAIKAITFASKNKDTLDIYACQSSQSEAQEVTSAKGFKYLKPVRLQENAVLLKSLFLDIDGDKPGEDVKGYPTMSAAVTALGNFIKAVGLPKPSIMVTSGGGLHVYWVLSRALTPQEWYPLACAMIEATKRHGLRLDAACTTDAARILRVPDTFNFKKDPKRPVRIAGKPTDFDYSVERIAKSLEPYKVDVTFLANRVGVLAFETPATTAPRAPLQGVSDLTAGIETAMPQSEVRACLDAIPNTKVDWNFWNTVGMRVFAATEGGDYGLQEWQAWSDRNPVAGASDNCVSRWETLHTSPPTRTGAGALINEVRAITGDPTWNARVRAPSVQPAMATSFGGLAGGTPLPATVGAPTPLAASSDLPGGYHRTAAGLVVLLGVNEDSTPSFTPISDYPLTDAWLQRDPWILHFNTTTERDKKQQIAIALENVGTAEMRKHLQSQGLMLKVNAKLATEFFVAWIQKLQESKDTVSSSPFGWSTKSGKVEGFVYGGSLFTPKGAQAAANPDPVTARQYAPTGGLQEWQDGCDLITLQGRPDLAAIVASSFGAPLVRFTGQSGLLMSTFSQESGIGKSTALKVAQAVWGDPVKAVQGLDDTQNSVINKIGEIRSLPLYWDELKSEDATRKFVDMAFRLSGGKEKARMTQAIKQREPGTWQTILISASNDSLLDYIVGRTSTTTAGLFRVFEFEVTPGVTHQIDPSDAQRIVARLNDNFGQAGLVYAQFLGSNVDRIDKEIGEFAKTLGAETKTTPDERFWVGLITCICMGARYANELGLSDFDEVALKAFMLETLRKMREQRASQPVDMRVALNVSNMLAQFLNAMRQRHMIITNRIHITAGKPANGTIKIVGDVSRLDGVYVHVGHDDKLLRISSTFLSSWLKEKELSRHIFKDALVKELGCKTVHGRIGSGTQFAGATEYLLEIDLAGHPLADFIGEA
jgi:hypothetical protein